jgi:hypothetical protein
MVLLTFGLLNHQSFAQDDQYFSEDFLRYENYTYTDHINSLIIHREGFELSMPIIELNSTEKIKLSFDDFSDDALEYAYSFIHCDANWRPSDIFFSEFAEGFEENYFQDFAFSINTQQAFVHHSLSFPNDDINFIASGNYIIKVYPKDEPETPVLTARFMIIEPKVDIRGLVKHASDPMRSSKAQEVDFEIDTEKFPIKDAYRSLKVILMQNDRFDNAVYNLKPREQRESILDFDYDKENIFDGGNEFRTLNIKSLRYQTSNMARLEIRSTENHVFLLPDENRRYTPYTFYEDINGRKLIKTEDYDNSKIEADYIYVHFSLPYDAPIPNGNIYVMGAISDWQFKEENKMKYNYNRKAYEVTLYLKQGFYDYHYIFLENGENKGNVAFLEGNHFQTHNEYMVLVYYKDAGSNYDRLIGMERFDSLKRTY